MKLNLQLLKEAAGRAAYNGITRLRAWWKIVNQNFIDIEDAINELDNTDKTLDGKIGSEATARADADSALNGKISNEATTRANADSALDGKISSEISRSTAADSQHSSALNSLSTSLDNEIERRKSADEDINQKLDGKVDKTQYASITKAGIVKLLSSGSTNRSGLSINENGEICTYVARDYGLARTGDGKTVTAKAEQADIDAKTNEYKPIVPATLDYAVNSTESVRDLKKKAHTHNNKDVLDEISAADIVKWNANSEDGFKELVMNTFYNLYGELQLIYSTISVNVYDGMYVSMTEINRVIDGGDVNDTEINRTIEGDNLSEARDFTNFATREEIIAAWKEEE